MRSKIAWTGSHTLHRGEGRVFFISFFGGRGYVFDICRKGGKRWLYIQGFTLLLRTKPEARRHLLPNLLPADALSRCNRPFRFFRCTTAGNVQMWTTEAQWAFARRCLSGR